MVTKVSLTLTFGRKARELVLNLRLETTRSTGVEWFKFCLRRVQRLRKRVPKKKRRRRIVGAGRAAKRLREFTPSEKGGEHFLRTRRSTGRKGGGFQISYCWLGRGGKGQFLLTRKNAGENKGVDTPSSRAQSRGIQRKTGLNSFQPVSVIREQRAGKATSGGRNREYETTKGRGGTSA